MIGTENQKLNIIIEIYFVEMKKNNFVNLKFWLIILILNWKLINLRWNQKLFSAFFNLNSQNLVSIINVLEATVLLVLMIEKMIYFYNVNLT